MEVCDGAGRYVSVMAYNARGRAMYLLTCPTCRREWRRQGRAPEGRIPVHVDKEA